MNSSIGVVFYNNEKLVEPFLLLLRKSFTQFKYNLFIVDNGSTDSTYKKLQENILPEDVLIHLPENVGCPKSCNLILSTIRQKFGGNTGTFFINSDVFVLRKNSLHCMENVAKSHPGVGVVFADIYHPEDFQKHSPGWCFCYITKETLDLVGDYDERFHTFYSDTDFLYRMKNLKCAICEDSAALHYWGETTKRSISPEERARLLIEDKRKFEEKWNCKMREET